MLDIKRIRETPDVIRKGLEAKGADIALLDSVIELDQKRRALVTEVEGLKKERNAVSEQIGRRKKNGEDTSGIQAEMRELGSRIAKSDADISAIETRLTDVLLVIPNIPHATTPVGPDKTHNKVVRTHGTPRKFDTPPQSHVEIGQKLGLFDMARAARMSGGGFPLYTGEGARLQRALIQFMLDIHTKHHGYTEVWPPVLVNAASMRGTGQLPKLAEEMYHVTADGLYLIPTAEVPVTNFYREEIIEKPLPVYLTAYSACFRREAGAAGKDTRGLIRVHQFDKVEMVKFTSPERSYDELEKLVADAEDILQRLGLTYRVVALCSGDMSFSASKCYDIELWAPGQNDWLEVSSCSNFEDFQARRAGIRFRDDAGKVRFVHTLNGSGVALPRLVVAILENGQQSDGSVVLPEAIVPYMAGIQRLTPPAR
jgi:seryl-tRNA synthetase